jgi:hypothetical protein
MGEWEMDKELIKRRRHHQSAEKAPDVREYGSHFKDLQYI